MPPAACVRGGEGMTGSRYRLPTAGKHRPLVSATTHNTRHREHRRTFPAFHTSVRQPASASKPSGRYAVGLRSSPDPNASPRRAHKPAEKNQNKASSPLTDPAPSGMTCNDGVFLVSGLLRGKKHFEGERHLVIPTLCGCRATVETSSRRRRSGLDTAIPVTLTSWRKPQTVHDPGKIPLDVAIAVALGVDCLADVAKFARPRPRECRSSASLPNTRAAAHPTTRT